jgi:hypothetical protein
MLLARVLLAREVHLSGRDATGGPDSFLRCSPSR